MKKEIIHAKCGGVYAIEYNDEQIPFLVCGSCGHKIDDWIKWSELYSKFWEDAEKWNSKRDAVVCLLGKFAHLYQKHYGVAFAFSLNDRGLFKGPEAHHVRKLLLKLEQNPVVAGKYLDWLFEAKVQQRKKKITSLGFLHTDAIINEFKLLQKKSQLRTRSTPLPKGMINWLNTYAPKILTEMDLNDFGDLKSILSHFAAGRITSPELLVFVSKLKSSGVVDENLAINNWSE